MSPLLPCLAAALASLTLMAADAVPEGKYYDDKGMRYLTLAKGGFDSTRLTVRMAAEPGSNAVWTGLGQKKDRYLVFAQEVEEGADRGTFFLANVSESKVDIIFKPGQQKAQDPGILGTYHRATDQKMQGLARKESQAAATKLQTDLRDAQKKWASADHTALTVWKEQWPMMRDRWMELSTGPKKPGAAKPGAAKPAVTTPPPASTAGAPGDKPAEYWFKLAQANMFGYVFVGTLPDPKTGTGWDGEYDDFAGGHVSITTMRDGGLHVTLTLARDDGNQTGTIDTLVKASDVVKDKNGNLSASYTTTDPEVKDPAGQAKIQLTKLGHYLHVEAQQTQHFSARAWFDGIYRGGPVPKE